MFRKLSVLLICLILLSIYTISHSPPKGANIDKSLKDGSTRYVTDTCGGSESKNRTDMIRPGDIVLVHGSTWIDRVIKIITRSNYSHVAGVVKPNVVVDILPFTKTGYKNLRSFSGQADVFTCDTLTDEQRKKIVDYVNRQVGTSYDYWLIVWQGCRYLLNWNWPYKADKSTLCSTLWADAYREAGVELCPDVIFPSPRDLADSKLLLKVCSVR